MYEFIDESRVTILAYDLSIDNIEERRKKALEFKTLKLAEQKLRCGQNVIKRALKNRGRVFSDSYQKEFALRIKPKKNETSI